MAKLGTTIFDQGSNDTEVVLTDHGSAPSPTAGKLYANTTSIYWEDEDLSGGGGETVTKKISKQLANTTGLLDMTGSACTAVNLVVTSNTTLDGPYFTKHSITGTSRFSGILVNSDASNTSTTMTDSGVDGHTITRNGNVNHRTDAGHPYSYKKSTAETSIYFDGTGDYLTVPINEAFQFRGDYTVEVWIYSTADPGAVDDKGIIAFRDASPDDGWCLNLDKDRGVDWTVGTNVGDRAVAPITTVGQNAWHHIAACRVGSMISIYVDGVRYGQLEEHSDNYISTVTHLTIGRFYDGTDNYYFTGYMDGIRVINGYAAYTSNFSVPTRPFTGHEFAFSVDTKAKYCGQGIHQTSSDVGAAVRMGNDTTGSGTAKVSIGDTFNVNSTAYSIPILFENSAESGHNHIHYNIWTEAWGNTEFTASDATPIQFGAGHHGTRGVVGGGYATNYTNVMDYIPIATASTDAVDFGDLNNSASAPVGVSNGTRGLFAGGQTSTPTVINVIDYITVGSTGNASDFGDLTQAGSNFAGMSNGYRAVFAGRYFGPSGSGQTMEFVNIAIAANAVDFGGIVENLTSDQGHGVSNNSRGVFKHGTGATDDLHYITISSSGNSVDFGGELTQTRGSSPATVDDGSRGLWAGGNPPHLDTIDYIQIGTSGDATDFGELSTARYGAAGVANAGRGVFCGGVGPTDAKIDLMDYVTIGILGDAADFAGELSQARTGSGGLSGS